MLKKNKIKGEEKKKKKKEEEEEKEEEGRRGVYQQYPRKKDGFNNPTKKPTRRPRKRTREIWC